MTLRSAPPLLALLLLSSGIAACGDDRPARTTSDASVQDSTATVREVGASVAGAGAAGGEAYSYRGVYAGIARPRLERLLGAPPADSAQCHEEVKPAGELSCRYHAVLGPDSARVDVDVTYTAGSDTARVARTIAVTRALPLDVDGVLVASSLADAFEKQTTFLDKRDASYGEHQAQVRMGSVNASRLNYVDVNVSPVHGREVLVVKMSRSGVPKTAPRAATKSSPVSSPATPDARKSSLKSSSKAPKR